MGYKGEYKTPKHRNRGGFVNKRVVNTSSSTYFVDVEFFGKLGWFRFGICPRWTVTLLKFMI